MTIGTHARLGAVSAFAIFAALAASTARSQTSAVSDQPQPGVMKPDAPATTAPQTDGAPSPVQPTPAAAPLGGAPNEVVVTGYRRSLQTAIQAKKNADNIQEDLAAEDIGKLPDVSIGEALARLPGLSTNRDRGNATQVSIRGLPPELANTLLNGREVVSAEADRNIRYETYPAELITGASVYKSPTAAQVEGAIAGQIDLRTIKPLDYKSAQIVVNAREEYNDLADDVRDTHSDGIIGSVSYVGQFLNRTLGVALGASARDEPVATVRTNTYRYTNSFADLNGDGVGNDDVPYGFEALERSGRDHRQAAVGTVQWQPNSQFSLVGDLFYSRVKYAEYQRGFSVQTLPFGNTFSNVTVQDGGATAATAVNTNAGFNGIQLENNNQYYSFDDILYAGGLNAAWKGDRWRTSADFGYSWTRRDALFLNIYTEASNPDGSQKTGGVVVNYATNPGAPSSFSFNQSLTDPLQNLLTNLEVPSNGGGAPLIQDELYSGRLEGAYDANLGWLKTVDVGFRTTSRDKSFIQRTQYASADAAASGALLLSPVSFSGDFSGLPQSQAIDVFGAANSIFGGVNPQESVDDERSSWDVGEKTYAGYVQGEFRGDLFGLELTGNAGVRVIRTEETSRGTQIQQDASTGGVEVPVGIVYHNDFTDVLPELNATLHLDDRQQIRFAVSKAIARAPLDSLNAGYAVYATGSPPSAYGGNPALQPFRANQVDLTYETYFNKDTALTVSLFYKDLDTFIVQQVTDVNLPVNGVLTPGTFQQPVNGQGGRIDGVEILYQQAFTFLPGWLSGFGFYGNYSYTDSSVSVSEGDNSIGAIQLPGLSKNVYNLSGYYAKYGFEARVAYRYRSAFSTQTGDADRILYNGAEGIVDYEMSYSWPETSRLKGLQVQFQANNLTDTPYILYYASQAQQGRFEEFGRRFWIGATYKFGIGG